MATMQNYMQPGDLQLSRGARFAFPALLLGAFLLHVQALFHPFFLDDYVYLEKAHNFGWDKLAEILTTPALDQSASSVWWAPAGVLPFYRPLGQLTIVLDYLLWDLNPFGFHLTNVLLHVLCTLLTWRVAIRIFGQPICAYAAAIAFALHPIHSEAVAWISGRFDLLVCLFVLASILTYLRFTGHGRGRWLFAALSLLCFALALGSKENALALPAVIFLLEFARWRKSRTTARQVIAVVGSYCAVAVLYLTARLLLFGSVLGKLPPPYGLDTSSPGNAMRELAWNTAHYLLDIVLCIPIEPAFIPLFWREHWLLFGVAVAASAALSAWIIIIARSRAAWIGLAWLILFTAPALLSMPGERNIYLGAVGLAIILGGAYGKLIDRTTSRTCGASAQARPQPATPAVVWRRLSLGVSALWILLGLGQEALMGRITMAGEHLYRQIQELLPDLPQEARVFVVHQSPLNSVGFPQAIRLRYQRPDLNGGALTLSPTLLTSVTDRIIASGPQNIRIERAGGLFFTSFVERFHLFSQPANALPELGGRFGITLVNPPSSYADLDVLEFRMPYDLDDPRLIIFYWDNQRARKVRDLRRIGELSEIVPWAPAGE